MQSAGKRPSACHDYIWCDFRLDENWRGILKQVVSRDDATSFFLTHMETAVMLTTEKYPIMT